jgi:chromosome segregation ATPase
MQEHVNIGREAAKHVANLQAELGTLHAYLSASRAENQESVGRSLKLQDQLEATQSILSKVQAEHRESAESAARLQAELDVLRLHLSKVQAEHIQELQALHNQLASTTTQQDDFSEQIYELQVQHATNFVHMHSDVKSVVNVQLPLC